MKRLLLLLSFVALSAPLQAQEIPTIRVEVTPEENPVGEAVSLQITVLVPTWFPSPPVFPSFELTNAITRLPPDSSRSTGERIGGANWAGVTRTYQIYPLMGATYLLADRSMTVTYADPDTRSPVTVDVGLPDVEFRAVVPAGAEALDPYIAGRELKLDREIEGDTETLAAGDALVVRYTAELDGLPSIFLPPLIEAHEFDGVSIYADSPVVEDEPLARRTETLTYVFDAGGEFTVPALELQWWNTETGSSETASLPALTVTVEGPPLDAEPDDAAIPPVNWLVVAGWALLFGLLLRASVRWTPQARAQWLAQLERRRHSESYAFGKLRGALRSGDLQASHRGLGLWLGKLDSRVDAREFAARFGDVELQENVEGLKRALFSGNAELVNLKKLELGLIAARQSHASESTGGPALALPPMNP